MGNEQTTQAGGEITPINPHENPVPFSANLSAFKNKHTDQSCFVLGLGPSLKLIDERYLKSIKKFSVNSISQRLRCDYTVIIDKLYPGLYDNKPHNDNAYWCTYGNNSRYSFSIYSYPNTETKWVKTTFRRWQSSGIDKLLDNNIIPTTRTSTFSAICLALYMGFKSIGVLGFDLVGHDIENHTSDINIACQTVFDYCKQNGSMVYNLSNQSLISTLPKCSIVDFVRWSNANV